MSMISFFTPKKGAGYCNMFGVLAGLLPDGTPLVGSNEVLHIDVVEIGFDLDEPELPAHYTVGLSVYHSFNQLLYKEMLRQGVLDESIGFQAVSQAPVRGMINRYPLRCHSKAAANELACRLRQVLPMLATRELEALFVEVDGALRPVLLADRETLELAKKTMTIIEPRELVIAPFKVSIVDRNFAQVPIQH